MEEQSCPLQLSQNHTQLVLKTEIGNPIILN